MKQLISLQKIAAVLFAMAIIFLMIFSTAFSASVIDAGRSGSLAISFTAPDTGIALQGAEFSVFKVAELKQISASNGTVFLRYTLIDKYKATNISLDNLRTASDMNSVAKTLAKFIVNNNIQGTRKKTGNSGYTSFTDLSHGLYLVAQTGAASNGENYGAAAPFLISIPTSLEDGWVYDISAKPKIDVIYGAVMLKKTDSVTGAPLAGATFRLDVKNDGGWRTHSGGYVTNAVGEIIINNLPYGTYRFIETSAPHGYILSSRSYEFDIENEGIMLLDGLGRIVKTTGTIVEVDVTNKKSNDSTTNPDDSTGTTGDSGEGTTGDNGEGTTGDNGEGTTGDNGGGTTGDNGGGTTGDHGGGTTGDHGGGTTGDHGGGTTGDNGGGTTGDNGGGTTGDNGGTTRRWDDSTTAPNYTTSPGNNGNVSTTIPGNNGNKLPQTGQRVVPVYILAAIGVIFTLLGVKYSIDDKKKTS